MALPILPLLLLGGVALLISGSGSSGGSSGGSGPEPDPEPGPDPKPDPSPSPKEDPCNFVVENGRVLVDSVTGECVIECDAGYERKPDTLLGIKTKPPEPECPSDPIYVDGKVAGYYQLNAEGKCEVRCNLPFVVNSESGTCVKNN